MEDIFMFVKGTEGAIAQWELIIRIAAAAFCGAMIGFERSKRQKEAGIRTHIIVCLGAALIMIISKYGFLDIVYLNSVQVDASRVASNVVTGISFLGAGVIFLKGSSVRGLTTSAGLWATAACGMAMGAGMYAIAIFTTVFIVGIQYFLHKYNLSSETIAATDILIIAKEEEGIIESIKEYLEKNDVEIEEYSIKRKADSTIEYMTVAKHLKPEKINSLTSILHEIPGILEIKCDQ